MKKYDSFCAALDNLKDIYRYEEPYGNVETTGLIGLFGICFEQAWKMMKEVLKEFGYNESATGSPKTILKTAYKAGMIDDEDLWVSALNSRNDVTHTYNQSVALGIIRLTKEKYYNMFSELKIEIDTNWKTI
ncbi:MAG: nucleotidyltransferase substrate binding protein [Clostridiales bacterium]|nr:nucleotidyltransferase substrate binding protein [Clostridiales bacterium]